MILAFIAVLNFMVKFSAITNMTSGSDIYDPKEFYSQQSREANAMKLYNIKIGLDHYILLPFYVSMLINSSSQSMVSSDSAR